MRVLAGPFLAAAVLLVVAGGSKLVDPLPLVRALRSAHLPLGASAVRLLAGGEVTLGTAAALTGSRAAAVLVALSYAGFGAFVLRVRSVGGVLASCGCFGRDDTPPTAAHVVLTATAAVVAAGVAFEPVGRLDGLLVAGPGGGLPLLLATAAVAVTSYLVLALLPVLRTSSRTAR